MFLRRRRIALLLIGDIVLFYISLFATIFLSDLPVSQNQGVLMEHIIPFSFLIVLWIIVFFIAGLYDKETLFFRRKLPGVLLSVLIINGVLAITFFYLIPVFVIAPKTNLAIYFVISFILILWWRFYGIRFFSSGKNQKALIVGSGQALEEVSDELKHNINHGISVERTIVLDESFLSINEITKEIPTKGISVVIIDMNNQKIEATMPQLYNLMFAGVRFFDLSAVYEELFDRIPLSLIYYQWFLKNVSQKTYAGYDILKRVMDIFLSLVLGILSLLFYPFIALATLFESGKPVIIKQKRIGEQGRIVTLYKFRSMERNEDGVWIGETENKVTGVGNFLRKTRLDELPQIWNILRGDISFVGPRPDISGLGEKLLKEIPYYNIRYMVKPGLSGWAQIKQDIIPQSVAESKIRLSYDLYYIKNRSFMLDVLIALKTIKTLLSRSGR
ncbi:MAG: sugar transferase [Parcubacteria group bacterium]|nr:sugar transferase [Parcubacteria group bacterium]